MRVQRGGTRSGVFLRGKCGVKLGKLVFPVILAFIKGICQTSPADVFGENVLFFGRGLPVVELQLFQQIDRVHVPAEFRLCAADAEQIIRNSEVLCRRSICLRGRSLCVRLGHLFRFRVRNNRFQRLRAERLNHNIVWQMVLLCGNDLDRLNRVGEWLLLFFYK